MADGGRSGSGRRRRFLRLLGGCLAGSLLLALVVHVTVGHLALTLSLLGLLAFMSAFFAAYYALLRIEG